MKLGVVSSLFRCNDCGMEWESLTTSHSEAQEHTRRTGHTTRGEVATAYEFRRTPNAAQHGEQP